MPIAVPYFEVDVEQVASILHGQVGAMACAPERSAWLEVDAHVQCRRIGEESPHRAVDAPNLLFFRAPCESEFGDISRNVMIARWLPSESESTIVAGIVQS